MAAPHPPARPATKPRPRPATPADTAAPAGGGSVDCTAVKAALAKIIVSVQLLAQMRDPASVEGVQSKTIGNFDPDEFLAALHELHALDGQTSVMGDPKAAINAYEDAGAGRQGPVRHQARDPGRDRRVQHARRHDRGVPRPPGGDRRGDGQRPLLTPIPVDTGRMSGYTKDPRVDAYIDALPAWQQDICRRVRDLVHAADPEVQETIKRSVQPYFVLDGNICALLAAKDHVNVFLYDPIAPDPEGIVTAGHDNQTGRTVAYRQGEADQRTRPARDVPPDHRQQPRRRLAQAQGRLTGAGQPMRVTTARTPKMTTSTSAPTRTTDALDGPARRTMAAGSLKPARVLGTV